MEFGDVPTLRMMCDKYFHPQHCDCGGTRTRFITESWEKTIDYAKLALKFYNHKIHKNFNLEEVVKLNLTASAFYCMTFKTRNAENNECCLFRGAVYVVGGPKVLLCEIKDEKEVLIPAGHDEYYDEESSGNMKDIYHYKWSENDLGDESALCSVDASCGSDVDTVCPKYEDFFVKIYISRRSWVRILGMVKVPSSGVEKSYE